MWVWSERNKKMREKSKSQGHSCTSRLGCRGTSLNSRGIIANQKENVDIPNRQHLISMSTNLSYIDSSVWQI